jgi:hypothetical protein
MLEKITIISFLIFAIWYTMLPGEVFSRLGKWLGAHLPHQLHNPVFDSPVCQAPWYGTGLYWLIWGTSVQEWPVVVIGAMGLNVILTRLFPDKDA